MIVPGVFIYSGDSADRGHGLESRSGVKSGSRVGEDFGGKVSVYRIQVNGYGCRNLYFSFCHIQIIHTDRETRVWRLYTDDSVVEFWGLTDSRF